MHFGIHHSQFPALIVVTFRKVYHASIEATAENDQPIPSLTRTRRKPIPTITSDPLCQLYLLDVIFVGLSIPTGFFFFL